MAGVGGRGHLRPWRAEDAPDLARAWTDSEIARWNQVPEDRSVEAARHWIEGASRRPPESPFVDLVMVDETDTVVGEIGLQVDREREIAELGYWVDSDRRRQGWGRELLGLASAHADRLELRALIAVSDASNDAAIALLGSSGWLEIRAGDGRRAWVDREL